jgi:ferritin
MIKETMRKALNDQINAEFYSAYLYLSMASYFDSQDLPGFANWMRVQTREELSHGMLLFQHVTQRGGRVKLATVAEPPAEWKSPLNVFEDTSVHERKVTGLIDALVDLAIRESDHAANAFLQWFVNEQVEEEQNAAAIAGQLRIAANSPNALFMIDRELAARVFTPPPQLVM